jgi:hypothetical protein
VFAVAKELYMDLRKSIPTFGKLTLIRVAVAALVTNGCNTPEVHNIALPIDLTQSSNKRQHVSINQNDTSPRHAEFTVTGTYTTRNFVPVISSNTDTFAQVSQFVTPVHETFHQLDQSSGNTKVDVLIVMDNSGSMADEQALIAANMPVFMDRIRDANVNYRVGLVTTDQTPGTMVGMITKGDYTDTNAENAAFATMINVGTSGSGNERPVNAVLDVANLNPNQFMRAGAILRVFIISDENECSTGKDSGNWEANSGCTDARDMYTSAISALNTAYGNAENYTVSALIWLPGTDRPPGHGNNGNVGNLHYAFVQAAGGIAESIWSDDYTTIMDHFGQHTVELLHDFGLAHTPNVGSVVVKVNGATATPDQYDVNGTTIHFHDDHVPPSAATIDVDYNYGQAGLITFILTQPAIAAGIQVKVNGNAAAFTFNQATNAVTLAVMPPQSASIVVTYSVVPPPRTQLSVAPDMPALNSVSITIGGVALDPSLFTVSGSTINLLGSQDPLATYAVRYAPQSSLSTQFVLSERPDAIFALSSGSYNAALNAIILNPALISVGQVVTIDYGMRIADTRTFPLAYTIEAGSLVVQVSGVTVNPEQYSLGSGTITFLYQLPAAATLSFDFNEVMPLSKRFALPQTSTAIAEVLVNGVSQDPSKYSFDATTHEVVFGAAPAAGSAIRVWYY